MKPIIEVSHLSKKYRLGERQAYITLRDSVSALVKNPFQQFSAHLNPDEFWALDDVSFSVNQGEVLGVVGQNGAGKSTLLKILSQITPPTQGQVTLRGRVGSLLEVGTGFHAELTGRENIYLNGAVLGMKRHEIKAKFDEIVAFADVERFLDTPLKHFSSGMYMRLAFAVAAHLDPEVLIVDEVLAVGDAQFQKKALGKMSQVTSQGRTVLFVSHNLTAVRSLCQKAILLEKGKLVQHGDVEHVLNHYNADAKTQLEKSWDSAATAPGNSEIKLKSAHLKPHGTDTITVATQLTLSLQFWNFMSKAKLNISLVVSTVDGQVAFNSISPTQDCSEGVISCTCHIPSNLLNDEHYRLRILVVHDRAHIVASFDDVLTFEVKDTIREAGWQGKWVGVVRPQLDWSFS